jgi:gliding motility-associatede transport system auxiliary component
MAVKTSTPWWISGILAWGLLCLFAGLRVLAHLETVSMVLTGLGVVCVAAATGVRAWAYMRESGGRRAVERLLLLCHVGVIVALLIYFFFDSSKGQHMLGLGAKSKAPTIGTFLWLILLGASFIPMIMVELSLGFTGRDWFPTPGEKVADEAAVELYRVREMATSGLTMALAAAFLLVTCNTMKDRDWRKDVSYFKTSAPGSATANMAKSLSEPLHVLVFFPPVNEVADEVENYFGDLNDKAGNVVVQRIDRDLEPAVAEAFKVTADGTVVLAKGKIPEEEELEKAKAAKAKDPKAKQPEVPQNEKLTLPTDIQKARRDKLRDLDSDVQKSLMKVIRAKRVAYFSVGHGEINDPKSAGPTASMDPSLRASVFKQIVQLFNYDVKDWDGFGKPVPDDCTILFVLAPHNALMDEEETAIDDYLEDGGSLFLSLDPKGEAALGPKLAGRLGVKFLPDIVEDDKEFLVARHNDSDHKLLLTNQFSSHASVTSLGRGGVRSGILLLESGHLDDSDFMVEKGQETPKRTYVVHSMATSYLDLNKNDQYDKDTEKRDRYNIVAAIEDPSRKKKKPKEGIKDNGMRAMVFADGDIFTDPALERVGLLRALEADAILWLGGEEDLAGETVSEKDVMIEHTKSEDVVYFYLSLVGAPVLFLGAGLGGVLWRRRRAQRRQS